MAFKDYEVILTRQWASALAAPIFIVDPNGTLVYYNEPAEAILGHRFEETGEMSVAEWSAAYTPSDEQGKPIAMEKLPLVVALKEKHPAHSEFWIKGRDQVNRHIDVTAFPLIAAGEAVMGAVAIFWEDRKA
jgi:PAS domain-containing protein